LEVEMPSHFDRFRLLNQSPGARIWNESTKPIELRGREEDPPIIVEPGEESPILLAPDGTAIIDVLNE